VRRLYDIHLFVIYFSHIIAVVLKAISANHKVRLALSAVAYETCGVSLWCLTLFVFV